MNDSNNNLLIATGKLTETNEKFAIVNKELAQVNGQIKQYQEKQNEFINIISHELRTPLHVIIGYIELLFEMPEKKFEYGESIKRNAERLQKIISDLRDMSKIDNNTLTLYKKQFNLNEVIHSVVGDMRERLVILNDNNNKVNIVYNDAGTSDQDLVINADKERIIQVISNILDNAIEFTKEGTISIDVKKNVAINNDRYNTGNSNNDNNNSSKSEEIIISITDTGKGIDSIAFSHLFSKFFSTSGIGGTGLGLYICKSIIEAHGGKIWAKNNEDGKGATFSFSLPYTNNNK